MCVEKGSRRSRELREAYMSGDLAKARKKLAIVVCRGKHCPFLNIEPELALGSTIDKFIRRFEYIEKRSTEMGRELTGMTLAEMDQLWDEAKKNF